MQPHTTYTDEHLLELMQQSDNSAFTEIYNRYWKTLYYSAHNILQLKEPAQDAVQEVFIALWKRRAEVQIESLKPYLLQAVRFQVLKAIRAEKTDKQFFKRLTIVTSDILVQEPLLYKELQDLFHEVIVSLPEDQQEIFRLHREEGLTYKQIAEQKNISVKTVEKKMSLALRQLRGGLDNAVIISLLIRFLH